MESTLLAQQSLPKTYTQIDSAHFGPTTDFGYELPAPETPIKLAHVTSTLKSLPLKQPSAKRWLLINFKRSPAQKGKHTRAILLDGIKSISNVTAEENKVSADTLNGVIPIEVTKRPSWTSNVSTFMRRNSRTSATSNDQQQSPVAQKAYKLEHRCPVLLVKGIDNSNYALWRFKNKLVRIDKTTIYIGKTKEILLKDCCLRPTKTTSSHRNRLEITANVAVKGQKGCKNQGTRLVLVLRDSSRLEKWRKEIAELMPNAFQTDLMASCVGDDDKEVQEEVVAAAVTVDEEMKTKAPEEEKENTPLEKDATPMKKQVATSKLGSGNAMIDEYIEAEKSLAMLWNCLVRAKKDEEVVLQSAKWTMDHAMFKLCEYVETALEKLVADDVVVLSLEERKHFTARLFSKGM